MPCIVFFLILIKCRLTVDSEKERNYGNSLIVSGIVVSLPITLSWSLEAFLLMSGSATGMYTGKMLLKKNSALLCSRTELYKCFEISYLTFSTMALKA